MASRGAGTRWTPLAALLAVLALACGASGSLLDSWLHTQVGRVTHAALVGPRAFVASAQGVLACLALRTGDIGAQPSPRLFLPFGNTTRCGHPLAHVYRAQSGG